MIELAGFLLAVWLLAHLVRWPFGGRRGGRVVIRFRVPLRERFPRAWGCWWAFVLGVVVPVLALASACGWWGL